jgi:predicted SprT family Zn-dependent metalloprotease
VTEHEAEVLAYALVREHRPEGFLRRAPQSNMVLKVTWSRGHTALGRALYPGIIGQVEGMRPEIRLSRPLWPRMPEAERRDTVIHEVAHLLTDDDWHREVKAADEAKRPRPPHPESHGSQWQAWMLRMGGQPRAKCLDPTVNAAAREIAQQRRIRRGDAIEIGCACRREHRPLATVARWEHAGATCAHCHGPILPVTEAGRVATILWRGAHGYYLRPEVAARYAGTINAVRGMPDKVIVQVVTEAVAASKEGTP